MMEEFLTVAETTRQVNGALILIKSDIAQNSSEDTSTVTIFHLVDGKISKDNGGGAPKLVGDLEIQLRFRQLNGEVRVMVSCHNVVVYWN